MAEVQSSIVVFAGESVEYRPLPGAPRYRVGSDGSLWSKSPSAGEWRRLKDVAGPGGYRVISLPIDGVRKTRYVHHLVLFAFVGPKPKGQECRHGDGNRSNNKASNLRWGTRKENAADRTKHGTLSAGEKHYAAVLTAEQVAEIKATYKRRDPVFGQVALAAKFGVGRTTIKEIIAGRNWKSVTTGEAQ